MIRNADGGALTGPYYWFEPAIRDAKIRKFSWHCLRHTFASRLVMAGVDLRTVQELMGHKSIQMTCAIPTSRRSIPWPPSSDWPGPFQRLQLTPKLAPGLRSRFPLESPMLIKPFQCTMLLRCGPVAQLVRASDS